MKRNFTKNALLKLLTLTMFLSLSAFMIMLPSGSPGGYTGSPADGKTCGVSGCHGATATTVTGNITSNVPGTGYIGGQTYTITVTVPGTAGNAKGFEVSPQTTAGAVLGTLTAGTGTKLVNSNKAVTHSSAVSTSPATWTFQWKAPAKGTGTVTFYGAFVNSFSNVTKGTLVINENTTGINDQVSSSFRLYPNPVKDHFSVGFYLDKKSEVKITINGIDGKTINTILNSFLGQGLQHFDFQTGNLASGNYILVLNVDGKTSVKKLQVK